MHVFSLLMDLFFSLFALTGVSSKYFCFWPNTPGFLPLLHSLCVGLSLPFKLVLVMFLCHYCPLLHSLCWSVVGVHTNISNVFMSLLSSPSLSLCVGLSLASALAFAMFSYADECFPVSWEKTRWMEECGVALMLERSEAWQRFWRRKMQWLDD